MAECRKYLAILIESSEKKVSILEDMVRNNEIQARAIKEDNMKTFDSVTDEKVKLVDELNNLDNGFTSIYERISKVLLLNKSEYIQEIKRLQELISEITDKSVEVQSLEQRNKMMIENYFESAKKDIRKSKAGLKTATDYYKHMSRVDYTTPQMLDQKK